MAFSDWEFFSTPPIAIAQDPVFPLVGAGSLLINGTGAGDRYFSGNVTDASGILRGHTRGKVRSVINVESYTAGYRLGFYCMASQKDLTSSGTCYALFVRTRNDAAADSRLELRKQTAGLTGPGSTLLFETSNNPGGINESINYVVELEWQADVPNLGGTRLVVRAATGTAFGSLVKYIEVVDTDSPYTSTVSEGIAGRLLTSSSEQLVARMDNTEIIRQIVV